MFEALFTSWILFLPLIIFENIYEGAKVFVFWVGSFFLALYWIIDKRKDILKVINKYDIYYFSWIIILCLSSLTGLDPLKSLIGGGYRHQGVIFFVSLWILGKTISFLSKKYKDLLTKGFIFIVIFELALIVFQKLFNFSLVNLRPIGTFGEPNAVAGFLNLGLFFSQNIYFVILIFISNLVLQSRSGVIMFLILVTPLIIKKKYIWALVLMTSLVCLIFISLERKVVGPYKFEDRVKYAEVSVLAFLKKPLLGYGLESTDVVFEREFKEKGIYLEGLMIDRSHNVFLDILTWSGILGFIPFCFWLFGNLKNLYEAREYKKVIFIIALLTFGMLQPLWLYHWILLFLILNW